jgi:ribose/xylose/arabinose/galactoside ABC-type transport system permease subunit
MKLSNWFARDGAERPLVWPCVTLALLFLLDLWVNPHFLALRMLDGHLFGAPIDILNRAAPLVLVATGMTLVIATTAPTEISMPQRPPCWPRSRFRVPG